LEASALTHASRRGLLARRSPLLKLQGDPKLIAMARSGNPGAFETIVDRYQGRLLGFCRQMLGSTEDAEDVLQEVFVSAYRAMLADEREINLRPWLYRIARNRCLNQLRRPTADAQESMDMVPAVEASSTAERVHNREEFRQILSDVSKLPETQRSALLLREMDALSYEEIAAAMETTVPSVKSLLVRARISLAEASQARLLTCGEVRIELSESAEGLRKVSSPVRRHVRECEECADFRSQIRSNEKVLAALSPVGPLLALKGLIASKLGFGGAAGGAGAGTAGAGAGAGAAGAGAAGAGAVGGVSAALGGSSAAGGLGAIGGAIGTKAVAGVVTAAVLTAGAVEVKRHDASPASPAATVTQVRTYQPEASGPALAPAKVSPAPAPVASSETKTSAPTATTDATAPVTAPAEASEPVVTVEDSAGQSLAGDTAEVEPGAAAVTGAAPSEAPVAGAHGTGGTVVVTVVDSPPVPTPAAAEPPQAEAPPAEAPPAEEAPPVEAPQEAGPAPSAEVTVEAEAIEPPAASAP
jgi:RNA polymerase sigma factor (sigma-70 family)